MSEVKLNLIDSKTILVGTIHGSIGDRCVAALSAEPETIKELEAALERFDKEPLCFQSLFSERCEIDEEPYDAGILVIDLAGRIVACESTYSLPGPKGGGSGEERTAGLGAPSRHYWPRGKWLY